MKKQALTIFLVTVAVLGITASAGANDVHLYGKVGIVANGDYSDPFGFADRLTYHAGLDVDVVPMLQIGPEFVYQRISASEVIPGGTETLTFNLYEFFGNVTIRPNTESSLVPYGGAGIGIAHGSITGDLGDIDFTAITDNKAVFHAFGGIEFGHFLTEVEISKIFEDGSDTRVGINFGARF